MLGAASAPTSVVCFDLSARVLFPRTNSVVKVREISEGSSGAMEELHYFRKIHRDSVFPSKSSTNGAIGLILDCKYGLPKAKN